MTDDTTLVRQAEKLIAALQHPDAAFKTVVNTVRQSSADIVVDLATAIRATAHKLIRTEAERDEASARIAELERHRDSLEEARKDCAANIKAAVAWEREACAKTAEDFGPTSIAAQHNAAAIRTRGTQ
jgi:septal ring factor EnvC (AmiA/AmiB activator)